MTAGIPAMRVVWLIALAGLTTIGCNDDVTGIAQPAGSAAVIRIDHDPSYVVGDVVQAVVTVFNGTNVGSIPFHATRGKPSRLLVSSSVNVIP